MPYQCPLTFKDEQIEISELKQKLEQFTEHQKNEFLNHHPVTDLVLSRSEYMDRILRRLWQHFGFSKLPHNDVIVKDRRDTFYGHKVCLTGGRSNLISDCVIEDGNPADSQLVEKMLNRHNEIYGQYPLKVAFDGGFASKQNLKTAKSMKIKDVCFSKKRGLQVEDMCRSQWVYNRLRRFRAGIESGISWIKRCFGFARCTWKGLRSFKSYVWASIVSANLLVIARKQIA